jgi:SAM-dependent methyltransferase
MSDDAGYDDIAEEYRRAKRLALFEVLEQTLLGAVGNLEGRSVLDLACGEGFNTRRLKMSGASRVVGVDISAEMIRLAQEEEVRAPLGIDYVCRSASDLGEIGTFDVVTAVFLLNYARSRDELRAMCDEIYRAVKPGQRFVSIADDGGRAALYPEAFRDYGFAYHAQLPMDDGAPMTLELRLDDEQWLDRHPLLLTDHLRVGARPGRLCRDPMERCRCASIADQRTASRILGLPHRSRTHRPAAMPPPGS